MAKPHRPDIKTNISRWEFFLVAIHLVIIAVQVSYYVLRWDSIPEVILAAANSHKGRDLSKYEYTHNGTMFNIFLMIVSISLSFCLPKKGYSRDWKGRSLSHDVAKAKRQYRIEISNLLCISVLVHLMFLLNRITTMEKQIELGIGVESLSPLPQTIIAILISWLIHHILWTKLSDKWW
jgi:hypothetical protein